MFQFVSLFVFLSCQSLKDSNADSEWSLVNLFTVAGNGGFELRRGCTCSKQTNSDRVNYKVHLKCLTRCSWSPSSVISWAISSADGTLVIKWACLEKWSTVVKIIMLPAEGGRPVMKSRDMWVQCCCPGRLDLWRPVGRGQRNPAGMELEALLWTHTWQADTYREGHQNKHCSKIIMQSKSG